MAMFQLIHLLLMSRMSILYRNYVCDMIQKDDLKSRILWHVRREVEMRNTSIVLPLYSSSMCILDVNIKP
jgi:hypothetical protein